MTTSKEKGKTTAENFRLNRPENYTNIWGVKKATEWIVNCERLGSPVDRESVYLDLAKTAINKASNYEGSFYNDLSDCADVLKSIYRNYQTLGIGSEKLKELAPAMEGLGKQVYWKLLGSSTGSTAIASDRYVDACACVKDTFEEIETAFSEM